LGDIAAYALNRLPPLYATTEEGANFQRENARGDLSALIADQVQQAISRNLDQPDFYPERHTIQKKGGDSVLNQVSSLLQDHAHKFEPAGKV
jgi:hypothetical protein